MEIEEISVNINKLLQMCQQMHDENTRLKHEIRATCEENTSLKHEIEKLNEIIKILEYNQRETGAVSDHDRVFSRIRPFDEKPKEPEIVRGGKKTSL